MLSYRTKRQIQLQEQFIHLRDSATESSIQLRRQHKELLEKQDYELHLATLQERNRIAREIHDNVGHMLTRCILQFGAIMTIHKEEPLHTQLAVVNETLNQAMNNIRESVHDLHNDSLDLSQAMREVMHEFEKQYQIVYDYDMTKEIPREVKYCFLAIEKEAFSNVVKHSNATEVTLICREHPGFYQLLFEDNGRGGLTNQEEGIGLHNMRNRIESLRGNISFFSENGFRILATIPKNI